MSRGFADHVSIVAQNAPPRVPSSGRFVPALGLLELLFLAAVGLALWTWARRRRSRGSAAAAEPSCGRCGYLVKGLTTFTCPECGSDLREVGIVGRRADAKRGPKHPPGLTAIFFRTVGWKLALVLAVFTPTAFYLLDYYGDHVRPMTWTKTETVHAFPKSRKYTAVTVTLTERFTTKGRTTARTGEQMRQATVDVQNGANRVLFVHDRLTGTNTYRTAGGLQKTTTAALPGELRAWMSDYGINTADPQVAAEVDAIATAINQSDRPGAFWDLMANQARQFFDVNSASFGTNPAGSNYAYEATIAATVALGLGLLALVWFRNRKRLSAALADLPHGVASTSPSRPAAGAVPAVMSGTPSVRTLTVMFSDVKDYTARAAKESRLGLLDIVRKHRDLVQPIAKRRGGRIVKSLGDGLLLTFDSATDAVLAGLEIQAAAVDHSKSAFAERDKVELRIAVSTGEVAVDDTGDVFGETVNLASRAQQHAAAGEVLFTDSTRATINRREIRFAEAGTFELKGIEHPVPLYRAVAPEDDVAPPGARSSTGIV